MQSACCTVSIRPAGHALGCHDCGVSCCVACAIHLESVTYCARCARTLLEASQVRATGPFSLF